MYELKVKKTFYDSDSEGAIYPVYKWFTVDIGNETPAINYQVNNLAELKDRQASYSQAIKLPKTPKNNHIFDNIDIFEIDATLPYEKMECRLYYNDVCIAGQGSKLIVNKISEYYETQIVFDNAGFFDDLNNLDISQIDLGAVTLESEITDEDKAKYPLLSKTTYMGKKGGGRYSSYWYFVDFYKLIEKIVDTAGYTLVPYKKDVYKNHYISLSSAETNKEDLYVFDSSANAEGEKKITPSFRGSYTTYLPWVVTKNPKNMEFLNAKHTILSSGPARVLKFVSNFKGKINIKITIQGNRKTSGESYCPKSKFAFRTLKGEKKIENLCTDYIDYDHKNYTYYNRELNAIGLEVNKGDEITFSTPIYIDKLNIFDLMGNGSMPSITYNFEKLDIEISLASMEEKGFNGSIVQVAPNLGFKKAIDVFKNFVQVFGLTVNVDNITKDVYVYPMDQLYDNISNHKPEDIKVLDWSKKLEQNSHAISFTLPGYAQKNNIKFEKKDDLEDISSFYVSNSNIEKEKDLFTIKFETGEDLPGFDINIGGIGIISWWRRIGLPYIPLYEFEKKDDGTYEKKFKGTKPHLLKLNADNELLHLRTSEIIEKYYSSLINMLKNAKCLEVQLNLTENDISEFNFFTPVYFEQFGAYFYVNKINNFVPGKLTKVELIKL